MKDKQLDLQSHHVHFNRGSYMHTHTWHLLDQQTILTTCKARSP